MTRKVILIITTLIAFCYSFRFGYILTAYAHGGQLAGIPFAFVMLIATITFFTIKIAKDKVFIFAIVYFLVLVGFSITIECIRAIMKENYFEFLYHESNGFIDKIFLGWIILGVIVFFRIVRTNKNK